MSSLTPIGSQYRGPNTIHRASRLLPIIAYCNDFCVFDDNVSDGRSAFLVGVFYYDATSIGIVISPKVIFRVRRRVRSEFSIQLSAILQQEHPGASLRVIVDHGNSVATA